MPTLFHSPGSCSNGILVLLNEIGAPFDVQIVNVREGMQNTPEYRAMNPKGKVPALKRDDGSVLTEFGTIAWWLGRENPEAGLWPEDEETQTRIMEALDYMVATIHMRGFTFVKAAPKFASDPGMQDVLRAHGREQVEKGLAQLSDMLGDKDYLFGDFSIADGALCYLLDWAVMDKFELPENLAACHARLHARPGVKRALG